MEITEPRDNHETPFPAFPESVWASALFRLYREIVGPTTESSDVFLWGGLLGALSFLVGRTAGLRWGPGRQSPIVFPVLLGDTAKARKSTAIRDALDLVARPLRPRGVGEDDLSEIVSGSGSGEGFAEALADRHLKDGSRQTGRRALFCIDELAGLLEKIGRGQAGNMMDFILSCFDAPPSWTHRVRTGPSSGALHLTGATGVFMAASTFEWLAKGLTDLHFKSGFVNRFLWLVGDRKGPLPRRPHIPEEQERRLHDEVTKCLNAVTGSDFEMTSDAQALHDTQYLILYKRQLRDLEEAGTARADVMALRIAMLLAAGDASCFIEEHHVCAAWEVVGYSGRVVHLMAERLSSQTMRQVEDRVLASAKRLAEVKPRFSYRDLFQRLKGPNGLDSESCNRAVNAMVATGELVRGLDGLLELGRGS